MPSSSASRSGCCCWRHLPTARYGLVFALLLVNAVARTFEAPALQSLVPSTVPRAILMQAVSAHASAGKMSQLIGPALGGLLYGFGAGVDFGLCALLIVVSEIASALRPTPA